MFPAGHPYYANVIGSHADIQAAKLDDVKRFFKQYYAPNNASLAIVGDFDKAQTKALVTKYFGSLKRGPQVPAITATTPPITQERRKVVTDRVELPRLYVSWITSPFYKPGDADADIAATILGGGKSSRLYKKLVYEKQIAQNVSAQQQSLMLGSVFQIEVTARPGHTVEELEKAVDEELNVFRTTAPDVAEVERARNTIETRIIEGLETLGGFGGVADRLNMYNHYLGTPDYLREGHPALPRGHARHGAGVRQRSVEADRHGSSFTPCRARRTSARRSPTPAPRRRRRRRRRRSRQCGRGVARAAAESRARRAPCSCRRRSRSSSPTASR